MRVDSLVGKGLSASALEQVQAIYKAAKSEKDAPQFVKAIIFRIKLEASINEDFFVTTINEVEGEVKTAEYPIKPILHSVLAEMYWRYYMTNRNLFKNRTETVNFKQEDIATWDLKKIVYETIKNFRASIENADSLKNVPLDNYNDIIEPQIDSKKFRPTLYDFLAHRVVDFFKNEEPDLIKPTYKFEISNRNYILPYDKFVKEPLSTKDTFSLKFYALSILQDLLKFHQNDKSPDALVETELERLEFVKAKAVFDNKDSLYLNSLLVLENRFKDNPVSTKIAYKIAECYSAKGYTYKPLESEVNKEMLKKALSVLDEAIKRFPDSDGAINCRYSAASIRAKSLSFTTEAVNLPNKPFRAYVSYKNISTLYVRVIASNPDNYNMQRYYSPDEQKISEFTEAKPFREWIVQLPDDGDYQTHAVEIKISELPEGFYTILISNDKDFRYKKEGLAYANTWVSDISYISRRKENGQYDITVLSRTDGTPLKQVSAQVYVEKYDYTKREYIYEKSGKYTTNSEGYFEIPPSNSDYTYFFIDFINKKDRLFSDQNFYQYRYNDYDQQKKVFTTTFFADRAIYRPGQTLYFKGIVLETDRDTKIPVIKPNFTTTVVLYDVNSQKVSEQKLTTNEYGTFNGTFTTPSGSLNGQMYLADAYGSLYFSVEEYKRPKFEVTIDPLKGTSRVGETITVKGNAKSYAGSAIDGAEVKYRVIRTAIFPSWWYWWRGNYIQTPQMEIANGYAKTNEKGEFSVDFKAIPDPSVPKSADPKFNYVVYVDITDINGENHSAQKNVYVAYKALWASVNIYGDINKNEKDKYTINTTNTNGEYEYAKGNIAVYKLKQPDRILRKRLWERADKFLFTKDDYIAAFPNDVYADEDNMYKWEKGPKVFDNEFDTKKDSLLRFPNISSWQSGKYILELKSKDKYGQDVQAFSYFTVFSADEKTCPTNDMGWFSNLKTECEPGEKASFLVGSKEKNVTVMYEIESKGKIISKQWLKLNNEQKKIEIPITEDFRGNITAHFSFVKNNRGYQYDGVVYVPFSNKQLDLEFSTFRDKLNPGQKETWKMTIKGKKGDKVAAELLAGMYDASLDAFRANSWYLNVYNSYYSELAWNTTDAFAPKSSTLYTIEWNIYPAFHYQYYDQLNWFGLTYYGYDYNGLYYDDISDESGTYSFRGNGNGKMALGSKVAFAAPVLVADAEQKTDGDISEKGKNKEGWLKQEDKPVGDVTTVSTGYGGLAGKTREISGEMAMVKARGNFAETAFFFPDLHTDADGNVVISFTAPEALTKWKFMGLAHTKDLKTGMIEKTIVTQKDLMVMPNAPRFFREGDKVTFSSKVSNLADKDLTGDAQLFLFDASTMAPIDALLKNTNATKTFSAKKGQSTALNWDITIPEGIGAITYKVVAKAGNFSDGEEMAVPVLTNRMLVTETMPLPIRGKQTKDYTFTKLLNSKSSTTLRNHKLTLEFSSNPAWYAIQALPYLMEYPYECAEQTFDRFYANSIASNIANSSPKIKAVFDSWKNFTPDALLSNLEKNQELKAVMLEETPWVLDAKSENERKQRIALLFEMNKMGKELDKALRKLQTMQVPNGGFPWFAGMPDDRYITQYIVTGFGHLNKLGVMDVSKDDKTAAMVSAAMNYLDNRIKEDYEYIKKWYPYEMDKNHIDGSQIQYLYARSYFNDKIELASANKEAFNYFKGQAKKYWTANSRYLQGMICFALNRYGDKATAMDIIKSLKENALHSEEMGMYWKDMDAGYYWWQAPIETQSLLIEAFDEVANDQSTVEELKVWLLKQKQTQDWKTTKATADACYALLLKGTNWLASDQLVEISMGDQKIDPKKMDNVKIEAGTGYFKTSWSGSDIKPEMGKVTVTKKDEGVAWGAVYWQYFEQLDKITTSATPLKLEKKLFIERNTETGPVIEPVTENTKIKLGDKIKVRIELRVDRDMEYVHMKDMRASGFEPVNVISNYKYQGGLGYYESTRDASTNFFISYLNKGTYVFEYALKATMKGDFSNGVTSIQCMYAPEFTSHSEGIRVVIGE